MGSAEFCAVFILPAAMVELALGGRANSKSFKNNGNSIFYVKCGGYSS